MQNPFFLSMGVLFSLLICLGIIRITLRFHQEWGEWKTNVKIRQILFSGVSVLSAIYIAIRFYSLSLQKEENEPHLIFFDFVILFVLTAFVFLLKLTQARKNNNQNTRTVFFVGIAILGFEILSFLLWLMNVSITADVFMTFFYLLLFALSIPIFFFREKDSMP